jgi:predicted tellurium resistance membrane protein TerC
MTPSFKNYFKAGFGTSAGFAFTILIGMLFAIPGLVIVMKENKKPKSERSTITLVIGFLLLFIGVALTFGMFGGTAANLLGNEF